MAAASNWSEAELVAALRRGEAGAFDVAYGRYRVRIYSFLCRLAGRRDIADDLFQETFMQLARNAPRLLPDSDLGAYLYTVARNRYLNHRRMSLFRLGRLTELLGAQKRRESFESAAQSPFEQAAANDTQRRLERGLSQLREPLREAILLVAVEGLELERAASILRIEPAALRQRLSRARAQLSELLQAHVKGDADES